MRHYEIALIFRMIRFFCALVAPKKKKTISFAFALSFCCCFWECR